MNANAATPPAPPRAVRRWALRAAVLAAVAAAVLLRPSGRAPAQAIPGGSVLVSVVDDAGQPIANGFRWILEEDNTYGSTPGVASPNAPLGAIPGDPSYTLGVNIHRSHATTVCAGDTAPQNAAVTFPATTPAAAAPSAWQVLINAGSCPGFSASRRYVVSVLPWHTSAPGTPATAQTGYQMSGRNIAAGQGEVTVRVHAFPVPTGQITVLVFADTQPINAAFDQPAEQGLGGFSLILTDPVGKVMQDAFGNPLGTTYQYANTTPSGAPADAQGNAIAPGTQPVFKRDPTTGLPLVEWLGDANLYTCPGPAKPLASYTPYERANCIDPFTRQPLAAGEAVIRFLGGDKYTIEPVPPGSDSSWILTGTLEGTRGNDAWIRPSEPRFNITLGQLNWLVFFGFVKPVNALATVANPGHGAPGTISGQVVYAHDMHPPLSPGLSPGLPVKNAYVGVNNLNGNDEQVYTAACDPQTGAFSISGVQPGTYQLAFWDKQIQAIIDYRTVTVAAGQNVALGPVAVFGWFGNYVGSVFQDANGDGVRDAGEAGIPGIPVNVHFTDGSLYGTTTTDGAGAFSFSQYFPWWRFTVADVDFNRFKPTGMTAFVDDGGPLPPGPLGAQGINPQLQPDGRDHRTEVGPVTSEAMQLFQDMTNRIDWGKAAWAPGENGGVHGIVNYAITRTEEDPATSAIDAWEPAVPRVTVRLHQARQDCAAPGATNENACWVVADGAGFPLEQTTSSWDDAQPTGCVGGQGSADQGPLLWANPEGVNGFALPSCAETFYNWDQIRPGTFDGAYWFQKQADGTPLPPGNYVVEVVAPAGYRVLQWGDRDIEFGDPKLPFLTLPPPCVGASYDVPPYHTLFPDQQVQTDFPGGWDASGSWTSPKAAACDRKLIALNPGANPEVDFNIFSWVPKAARIWGTVWNDLLLEFNPKSPNASGNFGVPWLPVSIKDWQGVEVARFYTDQWGHFDGLVPANYDIAPPIPIGLALAMYTIAPNDPGPVLDTNPASATFGRYITDPWFDPEYSQEVIRENWEFYSGRTTFIDTIVLPVGGFVGNRVPVNCAYTDRTPEIRQVSDVVIPQVPGGYAVTVTSIGPVTVPNPAYDPTNAFSPATVTWDHGFGADGTVTVGGVTIPPAQVTWAADGGSITAVIPNGVEGQLVVTRADTGRSTTVGITLHAADGADASTVHGLPVVHVHPPAPDCVGTACGVIQPAIGTATAAGAPSGSLVVVHPGTYQENVVLWKPLMLQGMGAAVTVLDNTAATANFALKQAQFNLALALEQTGALALPAGGQVSTFTLEQGAGILVGGCDPTAGACPNDFTKAQTLIDGLTVTGSSEAGGGVLGNAWAANVKISNDEIFANQGGIGGGIRFGEPTLAAPPFYDNHTTGADVEHDRIAMNGSLFSGGGGIALYAGSHGYRITDNFICANFSANYGGGIGHFGLSDGGLIARNVIVSNESFDEGGGVHVSGEPGAGATGLTPGAGSVVISQNVVLGNKGGDDGGGLRTLKVNGLDVAGHAGDPAAWYGVDILDNLIANNSSADAGGGIALDDTVKVRIIGNTIARNDSTATSSDSFGGACTENVPPGEVCPIPPGLEGGGITASIPSVAGVASLGHSAALLAALAQPGGWCAAHGGDPLCAAFSNPTLVDDVLWQNRSFYWCAAANQNLGALLPRDVPCSAGAVAGTVTSYWDLAVFQAAGTLSPTFSILTDGVGATPSATNRVGADPRFLAPYLNVYQATAKGATLGNFVTATFGPNGVQGNYHLGAGSPAAGAGSAIPPASTHDADGRTRTAPVDLGAYQLVP
jgi:uncharacterized protein (DUF2141 family)